MDLVHTCRHMMKKSIGVREERMIGRLDWVASNQNERGQHCLKRNMCRGASRRWDSSDTQDMRMLDVSHEGSFLKALFFWCEFTDTT